MDPLDPQTTALVLIEFQVNSCTELLRWQHDLLATAHEHGQSPWICSSKPRLVLLLQNEFTTEGGKLHDAVKGVMER